MSDRVLVAEPIVGWRIWKLTDGPQPNSREGVEAMADAWDRGENPFRALVGPRLGAVGYNAVWNRTVTAECLKQVDLDVTLFGAQLSPPPLRHPAPQKECHCGVWGLRSRASAEETLAEYHMTARLVLGQVQLWGHIIECWRAQHARPLTLELIEGSAAEADSLSLFYDAPVSVIALPERTRKAIEGRERAQREALARQLKELATHVGVLHVQPWESPRRAKKRSWWY